MYKRISLRAVSELSRKLEEIARQRGLSVNALVTGMAWELVEEWKRLHDAAEEQHK